MLQACRPLISQCGFQLTRRSFCALFKTKVNLKSEDFEEMETPANRQRVELPKPEKKLSKRYEEFREKLRSEAPQGPLPECAPHPAHEKEPLKPWPNNTNPHTGEIGGQAGPEPTRYGDWERKGRVTDF
ncbi:succinate dehydrogenase assembly factor 4, mitochondrial [Drosophila ficusphila]|uniref:succinate dehydrogenase assembly factor 4, mitochondrial n=1 Tax=Drosophila ficusphila TaxID=30025 RepID=UPI001C8ACF71|nr:succinate dehydrogenase assembly factor 4, mitochondrial [Drosophila ficusphila]